MKAVTRYICEFCKKEFKTPNRHDCKFNPDKKNCFSCGNFDGWYNPQEEVEYYYKFEPSVPMCKADIYEVTDIEVFKEMKYNLQCALWVPKIIGGQS